MRVTALLGLMVLYMALGGCAGDFLSASYAPDDAIVPQGMADEARFAAALEPASPTTPVIEPVAASPAEPVAQIARQVIYTGALTVLSPDPEGAIAAVRRLTEAAGGDVDSIREQRIAVRVPAAQFDAVMRDIAALGLVTDRQIDAADVTEELYDLDIRLDNLEALRGRMKALLDKADQVEDALKIEKELGRLTGEIESIKGRLRLLRDRVSLSAITVRFNTPSGTATCSSSKPWAPPRRWTRSGSR